MPNWKIYTITEITLHETDSYTKLAFGYCDKILFSLDNRVDYVNNLTLKNIYCVSRYPFTSWKVGDQIEIDNDQTRYEKGYEKGLDESVVRKASEQTLLNKELNSMLNDFCQKVLYSNFNYSSLLSKSDFPSYQEKLDEIVARFKNLETELNEWKYVKFIEKEVEWKFYKGEYEKVQEKYDNLNDKFDDINAKYEEMKEKYDDIRSESEATKVNNTRTNTKLEERLESANAKVLDLTRRLTNSESENNRLLIKLDEKTANYNQKIENLNNQLTTLKLESGEKDGELRAKERELEKKNEEIECLKNQAKNNDKRAEKTQEDLINEKLRSEKGNLELFATELKIDLEQISDLVRHHERLFQARKNYNQANIETHENNITRIKKELQEGRGKISIVNIQEICRKCERIAELSSELGFEPKTQSKQQTNYSYYSNRNRNWKNINPNFTPELVQEWKNCGFTYEECADWVNINTPNQQNRAIKEPAYYAWLRDVKQVDSYWVLNEGDSKKLSQEFFRWYQKQQQNQYQSRQEAPTNNNF